MSCWRKSPTQTTAANIWFDMSMSPGNPVPNYYIGTPGTFVRLAQSTDGGIPHGGPVAPFQKFLRIFGAMTTGASAAPLPMYLLDYLGFYPFLDESVTDEQLVTNTVGITRHVDGVGVQMMPVVVAGQLGGQFFTVKYTNSDGVSGRVTPRHAMTTQSVNGTILSSINTINSAAPFMALQDNDKGVRCVESITFGGTGDIGLIALALVYPVASHFIRGIDAPAENDFLMHKATLPLIEDDAYLNMICCPPGSLSGAPFFGYIKTLWA